MADARPSGYIRLPGRGSLPGLRGLFAGRRSLWLGADHLLAVESLGFRERYKRFRYTDIQALVATSRSRAPLAILLGAIATLAAAPLLAIEDPVVRLVTGLLLPGPVLLALAVHLLLGPMVVCRLYTAVQAEPLGSLGRERALERALTLLLPRLEAAQGHLAAEALAGALPQSRRERAPAVQRPAATPERPPRPPYRGVAHAVLFGVFVADAMVSAVELTTENRVLDFISTAGLVVALVALVAAASRHADPLVTPALRALTWTSLGAIVVKVYSGIFYFVYRAMTGTDIGLATSWAREDLVLRAILLVSMTIAAALGAGGLLALSAAVRRRRPLPATAPAFAAKDSPPDVSAAAPIGVPAGEEGPGSGAPTQPSHGDGQA